jgi:dihydrodipicolinate synthase/N-acetylneuraminate lyase
MPPPLKPKRKIAGYSAILLPFLPDGGVNWDGFAAHVARTADAGLIPAVNMDTGYVNLIGEETRRAVLERTRATLGGRPFVAGAFVGDRPGDPFDAGAVIAAAEQVQRAGGVPVIFQSYGLTALAPDALLRAYETIGRDAPQYIAFELGTMFAAFGAIYDTETYAGLLGVRQCIGAKHSSLSRQLEWERLALRDRLRPDFMVLTGNDLAIDMVMYGSDYLLGLSTCAPDLFARRDAYWLDGDDRFYELNDRLQYLGFFAFRAPTPAYKHSAAQFLKLRGWIGCDATHPHSPARPTSDIPILQGILDGLEEDTI